MEKVALIILLLVAIAVILSYFLKTRKKLEQVESEFRSRLVEFEAERSKLSETIRSLESQVERLSPWQQIADTDVATRDMIRLAEEKSAELRSKAEALAAASKSESETIIVKAQEEAKTLLTAARESALNLKRSAEFRMSEAAADAARIIDNAHTKAQEIAGDAYTAMRNAKMYEQTIDAIKNMIGGYGNQFIVPNHSLLDDLAEGYSHENAGEQLKLSRERSRAMVLQGVAAVCDYVEENRRTTAINFVTDAFNGKVDSILSRAKHDNFGKLQKEIQDAFGIVNHLGRAFRNARIRDEYLASRMEELKYAVMTNELRIQEQEEQRRIREELREEEKARREIEKAIRDAAKEEEILKRAIAKAQIQIDKATAEQKDKYEAELAILNDKLKSAEEKNQRALSMAQQTKRGHVYVISNIGSFGDDIYKIGLTRRLEPIDRIRELGDSSVPFDFDVHALIFSEDAPALEYKLHQHFLLTQVNKVNYRKAFFRASIAQIRAEIESLGLECKWTMVAEAKDYHESLAIEKLIKESPEHRAAWLRRQLVLSSVPESVEASES